MLFFLQKKSLFIKKILNFIFFGAIIAPIQFKSGMCAHPTNNHYKYMLVLLIAPER